MNMGSYLAKSCGGRVDQKYRNLNLKITFKIENTTTDEDLRLGRLLLKMIFW